MKTNDIRPFFVILLSSLFVIPNVIAVDLTPMKSNLYVNTTEINPNPMNHIFSGDENLTLFEILQYLYWGLYWMIYGII